MLKLQYFCQLVWRADSLEKTVTLGKTEGRRRGQQKMQEYHWLNWRKFKQTLGDGEGQWSLVCCSPWISRELDMTKWLNNINNKTFNPFTLERCLFPLPLNPGLFVTTLTNEVQQKQPCASSETSFYEYKQLLPVYLWAMEDVRPPCWTEYRERPGGCMRRKGPASPSFSSTSEDTS